MSSLPQCQAYPFIYSNNTQCRGSREGERGVGLPPSPLSSTSIPGSLSFSSLVVGERAWDRGCPLLNLPLKTTYAPLSFSSPPFPPYVIWRQRVFPLVPSNLTYTSPLVPASQLSLVFKTIVCSLTANKNVSSPGLENRGRGERWDFSPSHHPPLSRFALVPSSLALRALAKSLWRRQLTSDLTLELNC